MVPTLLWSMLILAHPSCRLNSHLLCLLDVRIFSTSHTCLEQWAGRSTFTNSAKTQGNTTLSLLLEKKPMKLIAQLLAFLWDGACVGPKGAEPHMSLMSVTCWPPLCLVMRRRKGCELAWPQKNPAMCNPVFPGPHVAETILSPLSILGTIVKYQFTI